MAISGVIKKIDISDIKVSPMNVRLTDRESKIDELAKSIEEHGLMQPVVLMHANGGPPYQLIVGQRRFRAHELLVKEKKVKYKKILAVFETKLLTKTEIRIRSLAENMQRVDLNHADKAEAITALYIKFKKSVRKVAEETGIPESTIRENLEFDEIATGKAKKLIRENAISKIDVKRSYEAARGNPKKMNKIIDEIIEMDVYTKDNLVRIGKENPKATASEIIKEAKKPVILKTVLIQLSSKTGKALNIASEELSEPPTSIAKKALEKWLDDNKFLGIDE